jgi:hypothetical protein
MGLMAFHLLSEDGLRGRRRTYITILDWQSMPFLK